MNEKILIQHMEEDAKFQADTRIIHAEFLAKVEVLEKKMEGVATKEDIAELKEFMKSVNVGIGIFRFTWNNASKIGAFILILGALYIFFKVGIMGLFAWLFGKNL